MKLKTVHLFILAEIIIASLLGFKIYRDKTKKVLGEISINPIRKEDLVFADDSEELKNFYELGSNKIVTDYPEWLGYRASYTINIDHLNERFDYDQEKSDGVFRIMALGDSHTFGQYVNTGDNYPEQLEDLLNNSFSCSDAEKFEVINLGIVGDDIQYAAHRFKLRGAKYSPDLILWFLKYDDFYDIAEETRERAVQLDRENPDWRESLETIYSAYAIARKEFLASRNLEDIFNEQTHFFKSFLDTYSREVILFTYSDEEEQIKDLMRQWSDNSARIHFFDEFSYHEVDRLPDTHPSAEGYTTVVEKLSSYLIKEKLIPCQ